jgi:hypothetical protein
MAKVFQKADEQVEALVVEVMNKYHGDLVQAGVTVGCIMVSCSAGHAVKHHGYDCAATIRRTTLKQRVQGHADAEIDIDAATWDDLNAQQRRALLDHEIEHLTIVRDENRRVKTDDIGRPVLKMKLHDWELGGFASVVERHGNAALDAKAAHSFKDHFGQLLMWAEDGAAVG